MTFSAFLMEGILMVIHCHVYMKDPFDAAQEGAVKNISGGLLCFSFVYMVEGAAVPWDL